MGRCLGRCSGECLKKLAKKTVKIIVGTAFFGLYVVFVGIHWTVPYLSYSVKLMIFVVVMYVLANLAAKIDAIVDYKRQKRIKKKEKEELKKVKVDIKPPPPAPPSIPVADEAIKTLNGKTISKVAIESLAEAIVSDIENEISERFNRSKTSLKNNIEV